MKTIPLATSTPAQITPTAAANRESAGAMPASRSCSPSARTASTRPNATYAMRYMR